MLDLEIPYTVKIGYSVSPDSKPVEALHGLASIIDALYGIDTELIHTVDRTLESRLVLDRLEVGSIKSSLRLLLTIIPDAAIKDLDWKKAIGIYLLKGKYYLLKKLEEKPRITSVPEIEEIKDGLLEVAASEQISKCAMFVQPTNQTITRMIDTLSKTVLQLPEGSYGELTSVVGSVAIRKDIAIDPETSKSILVREIIDSKMEMILLVKKPDYLGVSMWLCKHENKIIMVKVMDIEWLARFQRTEVEVKPGDSIRGIVEIQAEYGHDNKVVSVQYKMIQVLEVIRNPFPTQPDLM